MAEVVSWSMTWRSFCSCSGVASMSSPWEESSSEPAEAADESCEEALDCVISSNTGYYTTTDGYSCCESKIKSLLPLACDMIDGLENDIGAVTICFFFYRGDFKNCCGVYFTKGLTGS